MKKYVDAKENKVFKKPDNLKNILKDSFLRALAYEQAIKENKKAG